MSYTKQNFIKGQILKADHLNAMDAGIEANDIAINQLTEENALISTALGGMTIEGYERDFTSGYYDVIDLAEKHEGEYCYNSNGVVASIALAGYNWYKLTVNTGEKYLLTTKHGASARACFLTEKSGGLSAFSPLRTHPKYKLKRLKSLSRITFLLCIAMQGMMHISL